jgi:hypothetical protein
LHEFSKAIADRVAILTEDLENECWRADDKYEVAIRGGTVDLNILNDMRLRVRLEAGD